VSLEKSFLPSFPRLPIPTPHHLSLRLTIVESHPGGELSGNVRVFSGCQEVKCATQEGHNTNLSYRWDWDCKTPWKGRDGCYILTTSPFWNGRHRSCPSGHSTFHSQIPLPGDPFWLQWIKCSRNQPFPHPNPEDLLAWCERYWFQCSWWLPAKPLIFIQCPAP
jgi:hypothetical protein